MSSTPLFPVIRSLGPSPPPARPNGLLFGSSTMLLIVLRNSERNTPASLPPTWAADSIELYHIDFTASVALVFGNEHSGVSDEIRPLADGNFVIPQVGIIRSLNISVACAVCLYEAFRQKKLAGHYNGSLPQGSDFELLLKEWELNEDESHLPDAKVREFLLQMRNQLNADNLSNPCTSCIVEMENVIKIF